MGAGTTQRRGARLLVLAAVFVCAACGLVYELALVALGSYLLGSSITQTSLVVAVSMFAMGIGAILVKPLTDRPLLAFSAVELSLAMVGGFSVTLLYAAFAWLHVFTPAMITMTLLIGGLVGAEIPLLMELLQRLRPQRPSEAIADLSAVDYIGALVGGLAFPFVLLPVFGLLTGTLVVAALNVVAAGLVAVVMTRGSRDRGRHVLRATLACGLAAAMLGGMAIKASSFELSVRQALYRDPIIHAERSTYQDIVVTRGAPFGPEYDDVRLFLDGDLQFSSLDEYRYHEMLVHPAMRGPRRNVLILGGGDGLAAREVLRYSDVEWVTLVDIDDDVVELARTFDPIRDLTEGSFDDRRLRFVAADAFTWIRDRIDAGGPLFDVIVVDFPDPDSAAIAKLYTVEMYAMLRQLLAADGRMAVQAGSPYFARDAFWSVRQTIEAAGFGTHPYLADVPSFGTWGFVLAGNEAPSLRLADDAPAGLRYASDAVLAAADVFPLDRAERTVSISTLLDPAILEYTQHGWVGY